MKPTDTFQSRLDKAMKIRNIKQVELHEKTGISESLLSKYLSGDAIARQRKLTLLADNLDINEVWLMGYDVPMEKDQNIVYSNNDFYKELKIKYGNQSVEFLNYYNELNNLGKSKALDNIKDLTKINEYTDKKTELQNGNA